MDMKNITYPNYERCITNVINSVLKYYHVESNINSLPEVDKLLEKDYDNIVVMIFDGLGQKILDQVKPKGNLMDHRFVTVTSVFPPTTVAAMNSYYSGLYPAQTGWLGWAMHFKELGRTIDVFPLVDSVTRERIDTSLFDINKRLPYEPIFPKIKRQNPDVHVVQLMDEDLYSVKPRDPFLESYDLTTNNGINKIITSIKSSPKNFIFYYNPYPDKALHEFGVKSQQVSEIISNIDKDVKALADELKDTKTLILIGADHGLIDIEYEYLDEYPELVEMLTQAPSLEARAISLFVKAERRNEFKKLFNSLFKDRYLLLTKKQVKDKKLFGLEFNAVSDDFIGDFLAVATKKSHMIYRSVISNDSHRHIAAHAGLTCDEMNVSWYAFEGSK
jgi:predicted AlkP superfamily pyrophosphatase or phosphodiesterase